MNRKLDVVLTTLALAGCMVGAGLLNLWAYRALTIAQHLIEGALR